MKHKIKINIFLILILLLSTSQAFCFEAQIKWSTDLHAPLTTGIIVLQDKVILGDEAGRLHALSTDTGAELWSFNGINAFCGTPTLSGDRLITAQTGGEIDCLNLSDGSVLWQHTPEDDIDDRLNDGTAYGEGLVFAAGTGGSLYALDGESGRRVWSYKAGQGLRTAPAYGEGLVFQGEYDGLFSIIDAKTGERLNGGGAGAAVNTPLVSDGKVYFSAWDGAVHSVQIQDVIPLWSVNVKDPVTTSPVLGEGMLIVGTARGLIVALNEETGETLWQYDSKGGGINSKPVIADGLVFAAASEGLVHVLEAKTGKVLHRMRTSQGIEMNLAYADGILYFGGNKGIIYAIQNKKGKIND